MTDAAHFHQSRCWEVNTLFPVWCYQLIVGWNIRWNLYSVEQYQIMPLILP